MRRPNWLVIEVALACGALTLAPVDGTTALVAALSLGAAVAAGIRWTRRPRGGTQPSSTAQPGKVHEPAHLQHAPAPGPGRGPAQARKKPQPDQPPPRAQAIELLTVGVLVVGLWVGLLAPRLVSTAVRARQLACKSNLQALATAMESYRNDCGLYPKELEKLVPTYLAKLPKCPSGGRYAGPEADPSAWTCSVCSSP